MVAVAKLKDIEEEWELGYRHSPKHFYPNSFSLEGGPGRLYVVGITKRHIKKNYRIVAVVKRRARH